MNDFIPHAGDSRAAGRVNTGVCDFLYVYVRALNEKTARANNTSFGTHILYGSRSARIETQVNRSKVKVT